MGSDNGIISESVFRFCCAFTLLLMVAYSEEELKQGDEKTDESMLSSMNGMFTLGVYTPKTDTYSNTSYIGIWYGNDSTSPVWIANPNSPFPNRYGSIALTLDPNCSLKIMGRSGYNYSFSVFDYFGAKPSNSCSAILREDGNLVVQEQEGSGSVVLWQSFDHPTDTLLDGMKIGMDLKTGSTWRLTSWISQDSPRSGAFTLTINPNNTKQLLILLRGEVFWNSGEWNQDDGGFEFLKISNYDNNQNQFKFNLVSNERESYFKYYSPNLYGLSEMKNRGLRLSVEGDLLWGNEKTIASCPPLFENELEDDIDNGCVWIKQKQHQIPAACRKPESYNQVWTSSVSTNASSYFKTDNLTMYECKNICIFDCDCLAYCPTNQDQSGCQLWSRGTTFFLPTDSHSTGFSFLDEADLPFNDLSMSGERKMAVWLQVIIGLIVPAAFLLICFIIYLKWRTQVFKVIKNIKKSLLRGKGVTSEALNVVGTMNDGKKNPELHFFHFETLVSATNNFADECKLGQGGFGPVYKGILMDGQEVAIKRLSKNSGQGLVEFKNEIILIAKLQHTNLVRLIGCCIYKEEKLLVYEYMPNKSLDFFLFDLEKKLKLDWKKRWHIIQGIVQGLLYLHYYSRVRIIHRDLKVSNILLDDEMNAKISDFGMARVFKPSEHEANTSRVVGTYGYISPEYAMEGIFSIKSDVYSFGILLLEIATSRKNYNNYDIERSLNLIGYAWELWVNGRGEELIDSDLCTNSDEKTKALRCIHVSLLCVQQIPMDRPTIQDVYFMINNDSTQLQYPKQPAFYVAQSPNNSSELEQEKVVDSTLIRPAAEPTQKICSLSTMTVSVMVAR